MVIKRLAASALKKIAPLFFDGRYLTGFWFDDRKIGWMWVLKGIWFQRILGINRGVPVPITPTATVPNFSGIVLGKDNLNNFQSPGIYLQSFSAKIYIGDRCYIGPNVGIITANHDAADASTHLPGKDVVIGNRCWIGMNSVILPGVRLGDGTVVGAGSVVTKSFEQGYQVIAGNPAKVIRQIEQPT